MTVKAEVSPANRIDELILVIDENGEPNVVYTDNKYVSKQVYVSPFVSHFLNFRAVRATATQAGLLSSSFVFED